MGAGRSSSGLRRADTLHIRGRALDGSTARALGAPPRPTRQLPVAAEGGYEVTGTIQPDSRLDLVLERVVGIPPGLVWAAWIMPEHVKKWFTPGPWKTSTAKSTFVPGVSSAR